VGGAVLDAVANLLGATKNATIATGILNIWMHEPKDVAAAHATLTGTHGDRFLLGIGVSHAPLIDAKEPGRYRKPMAAIGTFLDGLDNADLPVAPENRVLAALGPKMLKTAAERSRGAHPYLVTPEHTAIARETLGAAPLLLPEQTVILAEGRDEARTIGTNWLRHYLAMPNYVNNLLRLGFTDEDIASVSDRLFDGVIAWGDEEAVVDRIRKHQQAGADHVCVQVLSANQAEFPTDQWRRLASAVR
jgi:probable F420-dependent oxidoreductase